jgi:hypothetical protein
VREKGLRLSLRRTLSAPRVLPGFRREGKEAPAGRQSRGTCLVLVRLAHVTDSGANSAIRSTTRSHSAKASALASFRLQMTRTLGAPKPLVVIAIGRFDNISPGIELHAHLSEIVAEKASNAAAHRRISPAHAFAKEQIAAFVHPSAKRLLQDNPQSGGFCHQSRKVSRRDKNVYLAPTRSPVKSA